jgi:hypothetical protein
MRIPRLFAVLVFAPLGCSEPLTPPASIRVATSAAYAVRDVPLAFSVVNAGNEAVVFARCCDLSVALDRRVGGDWQPYSGGGACLAFCPQESLILAPGARYDGSTVVSDTGTFRLRLGRVAAGSMVWDVTSNSFRVQPGFELLRGAEEPGPGRN